MRKDGHTCSYRKGILWDISGAATIDKRLLYTGSLNPFSTRPLLSLVFFTVGTRTHSGITTEQLAEITLITDADSGAYC